MISAALRSPMMTCGFAEDQLSDFSRGHGVIDEEKGATPATHTVAKFSVASLYAAFPQILCMSKN